MSTKKKKQIAHAWIHPSDPASTAKIVVYETPLRARHGFQVLARDERQLEYKLQAMCIDEVERLLIDLFSIGVGDSDEYTDEHEDTLRRVMQQVEAKATTTEYEPASDSQ